MRPRSESVHAGEIPRHRKGRDLGPAAFGFGSALEARRTDGVERVERVAGAEQMVAGVNASSRQDQFVDRRRDFRLHRAGQT